MAKTQTDDPSTLHADSITAYTPATTTSSITSDEPEPHERTAPPPDSSIPHPGSSFIIQSASTGKVLTFRDGHITLGPAGNRNMVHWDCVSSKGWLGFREPRSGMYLGYDKNEELCCAVRRQDLWESFCVRQRPQGGYWLLMTHYALGWFSSLWNELRPVGVKGGGGEDKVALVEGWEGGEVAWVFIEAAA